MMSWLLSRQRCRPRRRSHPLALSYEPPALEHASWRMRPGEVQDTRQRGRERPPVLVEQIGTVHADEDPPARGEDLGQPGVSMTGYPADGLGGGPEMCREDA